MYLELFHEKAADSFLFDKKVTVAGLSEAQKDAMNHLCCSCFSFPGGFIHSFIDFLALSSENLHQTITYQEGIVFGGPVLLSRYPSSLGP